MYMLCSTGSVMVMYKAGQSKQIKRNGSSWISRHTKVQ